MKKRAITALLCFSILVITFIFINNSTFSSGHGGRKSPLFLAHRGLAQTFDIRNVTWNTNTAAIIHKPEHDFIENTLPSMKAAFEYGADIVELDIRITKDKKLVVFHDYALNFRTEKTGNVSDYTLDELQELDVGYGYTYDNGATFPLRTKGIGMMPSFAQVIKEFPRKKFLVHIRDEGPEIGALFLNFLTTMNNSEIRLLSVYGNDGAIDIIKKRYPEMKSLSVKLLKNALVKYEIIGWTGYIPQEIRNMEIHLPLEYARFLWGWPEKFVSRMERVNSRVVLVKKVGQWSGGFDSITQIKEIPHSYYGYIWTERIDRVGTLKNGFD